MKQPNTNAKMKLRYRFADGVFRFLRKNWWKILIAIPVIIVFIWVAKLVYNELFGPSLWDKIGDFFTNAWNGAKDGISNAWNGAKDGVSNAWDSVTGKATDIWTDFTGLFS